MGPRIRGDVHQAPDQRTMCAPSHHHRVAPHHQRTLGSRRTTSGPYVMSVLYKVLNKLYTGTLQFYYPYH
jgi:hypothetical protein